MHLDFKLTAGEVVEYLFFSDNNKFPDLFQVHLKPQSSF